MKSLLMFDVLAKVCNDFFATLDNQRFVYFHIDYIMKITMYTICHIDIVITYKVSQLSRDHHTVIQTLNIVGGLAHI